jgi:hypothetical protein
VESLVFGCLLLWRISTHASLRTYLFCISFGSNYYYYYWAHLMFTESTNAPFQCGVHELAWQPPTSLVVSSVIGLPRVAWRVDGTGSFLYIVLSSRTWWTGAPILLHAKFRRSYLSGSLGGLLLMGLVFYCPWTVVLAREIDLLGGFLSWASIRTDRADARLVLGGRLGWFVGLHPHCKILINTLLAEARAAEAQLQP